MVAMDEKPRVDRQIVFSVLACMLELNLQWHMYVCLYITC